MQELNPVRMQAIPQLPGPRIPTELPLAIFSSSARSFSVGSGPGGIMIHLTPFSIKAAIVDVRCLTGTAATAASRPSGSSATEESVASPSTNLRFGLTAKTLARPGCFLTERQILNDGLFLRSEAPTTATDLGSRRLAMLADDMLDSNGSASLSDYCSLNGIC